jgi:hypothetical protein
LATRSTKQVIGQTLYTAGPEFVLAREVDEQSEPRTPLNPAGYRLAYIINRKS